MVPYMVLGFAGLAVFLVLFYFLGQRRHDTDWRRFRQRHRERRLHPPPEQPVDPNFQFKPAREAEKDKPAEPN